jgi:hypothetical protein
LNFEKGNFGGKKFTWQKSESTLKKKGFSNPYNTICFEAFENIGICRVLRYKGGEGVKNLGKSRYVLYGRPLIPIFQGKSFAF